MIEPARSSTTALIRSLIDFFGLLLGALLLAGPTAPVASVFSVASDVFGFAVVTISAVSGMTALVFVSHVADSNSLASG